MLRGGERLPTIDPLQDGDFYAFVCRPRLRPELDVYAWTLRDPLPTLPIPLAQGDPDVPLDLQAAFTDGLRPSRLRLFPGLRRRSPTGIVHGGHIVAEVAVDALSGTSG